MAPTRVAMTGSEAAIAQSCLRYVTPGNSAVLLPLGRVYLHPMAVAAWVGMYATALNLLPSSQLDGGHIVYALAPRAHRLISWITVTTLVALGTYTFWHDHKNSSWWLWAGILTVMNILTSRLEQAPEHPPLPRNRWVLALLAAALLALTFHPNAISLGQ